MCLFNSKSKPSDLDIKEKPTSIVKDTPSFQRSSQVTGKRRSNQTLENPNPKSSSNSLSSTGSNRISREERRLPMPRKTPGGLPRDPVVLGAPMSAGKLRGDIQEQTSNTTNDRYTYQPAYTSMESSNIPSSEVFGMMNAAASVAVMTGGGDGGYVGGGF